jgi:hypothetical protein
LAFDIQELLSIFGVQEKKPKEQRAYETVFVPISQNMPNKNLVKIDMKMNWDTFELKT